MLCTIKKVFFLLMFYCIVMIPGSELTLQKEVICLSVNKKYDLDQESRDLVNFFYYMPSELFLHILSFLPLTTLNQWNIVTEKFHWESSDLIKSLYKKQEELSEELLSFEEKRIIAFDRFCIHAQAMFKQKAQLMIEEIANGMFHNIYYYKSKDAIECIPPKILPLLTKFFSEPDNFLKPFIHNRDKLNQTGDIEKFNFNITGSFRRHENGEYQRYTWQIEQPDKNITLIFLQSYIRNLEGSLSSILSLCSHSSSERPTRTYIGMSLLDTKNEHLERHNKLLKFMRDVLNKVIALSHKKIILPIFFILGVKKDLKITNLEDPDLCGKIQKQYEQESENNNKLN
jgi:hypothetical protein